MICEQVLDLKYSILNELNPKIVASAIADKAEVDGYKCDKCHFVDNAAEYFRLQSYIKQLATERKQCLRELRTPSQTISWEISSRLKFIAPCQQCKLKFNPTGKKKYFGQIMNKPRKELFV